MFKYKNLTNKSNYSKNKYISYRKEKLSISKGIPESPTLMIPPSTLKESSTLNMMSSKWKLKSNCYKKLLQGTKIGKLNYWGKFKSTSLEKELISNRSKN